MRVVQLPVAEFGLYRVTGRRNYRGHEPGSEFEARLDRNAERRAVIRGDIELLERVTPELRPGSFTFPQGWLPSRTRSDHRGAERRLSHSGGS